MDAKQSLYLIALLLAALVLGPMVVLTQDNPERRARPLRAQPMQDRVLDAPASPRVKDSRSPLPDARPANTNLPGLPQ